MRYLTLTLMLVLGFCAYALENEWDDTRISDDSKLSFGDDHDFRFLYDEAGDDRLEVIDSDDNVLLHVTDTGTTGTIGGGTITGVNVTTGADPGHTHTGASLGSIDISDDTNLAVTAPVVLTDDTLSLSSIDISTGTNLAVSAPIVLTDDTLSHSAADGYKHIPSTGASAQILQYSAAGTAKWITMSSHASIADGGAVTLDLSSPPAIGGTTPAAGAFTTLSTTGDTGIGTGTPSELLEVEKDQDAATRLLVDNNTAGTAASARVGVASDTAGGDLVAFSGTYTTSNQYIADSIMLRSDSTASGGLVLSADGTNDTTLWTNGVLRATVDSGGFDVVTARNAETEVRVTNLDAGASAHARFYAIGEACSLQVNAHSTGTTASRWGAAVADMAEIVSLNDAGLRIGTLGSSNLILGTNSTAAITVDTSQNVGIGTAGPDRALDVLDAGGTPLRLSKVDGTTYHDFTTDGTVLSILGSGTGYTGLVIGAYDTMQGSIVAAGHTTGYTSGGAFFASTSDDHNATIVNYGFRADSDDLCIGPNTDTDSLKYDGGTGDWGFTSGNVGIGTAAPGAKLEVVGTVLIPGFIRSKSITILQPDLVQAETDAVPMFAVEATEFPNGITIDRVYLKTSASSTLSANLEKWSSPADGAPDTLTTIATSSSTEADEAPDTTATVGTSEIVTLDLDTTDVDWLEITVVFHETAA